MKIRIMLQLILWKSTSSELNAVTGNRYIYPATRDRSLLSPQHVKVSSKSEAEVSMMCSGEQKTLKIPAVLQSFFMGLSPVIKSHITEAFHSILLDETTLRALKMRTFLKSVMQSKGGSRGGFTTDPVRQRAECRQSNRRGRTTRRRQPRVFVTQNKA